MPYEKVKPTWNPDDPVMPEHLNRIETQYDEMKADLEKDTSQVINIGVNADPEAVPTSHTGNFKGKLNRIIGNILNRIKAITGQNTWTVDPPIDLQTLREHVDHPNPHSGSEPADPNIVKTTREATFKVPIQADNNNQYERPQIRNIIVSNRPPLPEEGEDGDIWLIYID